MTGPPPGPLPCSGGRCSWRRITLRGTEPVVGPLKEVSTDKVSIERDHAVTGLSLRWTTSSLNRSSVKSEPTDGNHEALNSEFLSADAPRR